MLRTVTIALVAICFSAGAFAADRGRLRSTRAPAAGSVFRSQSATAPKAPVHAAGREQKPVRALAADRGPYADPAAPYKADRLSSPDAAEPIANLPGQVTVLTRQVLDDKNATTLSDALRTTAGVTVGR